METDEQKISIARQCELLGLNRSSLYYKAAAESSLNLELMKLIDEQYTSYPFYGVRRMTAHLRREGFDVNSKRVARLMRKMGMRAIYPAPQTSVPNSEHRIYPYLLRGVSIHRVNQVWSCDITYIRLVGGFLYLIAVLDWHSRFVLSWELSNTLGVGFCVEALDAALVIACPEIFNTDQGAQFTSRVFTQRLESHAIQVSMDGRGRAFDNIFIERLWRSVKYEDVYLKDYQDGWEARVANRQLLCFLQRKKIAFVSGLSDTKRGLFCKRNSR